MDTDPVYKNSPSYTEHLGHNRQYLRDIILGVNDGLVSMFLLVAGVVGGGMATRNVLLTGVAGAIAGAISMASGEYIATKTQEEVFEGELALEKEHIQEFREDELHELGDLLEDIGLDGPLRDEVVTAREDLGAVPLALRPYEDEVCALTFYDLTLHLLGRGRRPHRVSRRLKADPR